MLLVTGWLLLSMITTMPHYVELSPPPIVIEGDKVRLTAKLHQHTDFTGGVRVTLTATVGDDVQRQQRTVQCDGKGIFPVAFDAVTVTLPEGASQPEMKFKIEATAGDNKDVLTRSTPIRPWGMEYADSKAGIAGDNRIFELALPPGQTYTDRRLTIRIGPSAQRTLIDAALGGDILPRGGRVRTLCSIVLPPTNTNATTAGNLIAVAHVLRYLATPPSSPARPTSAACSSPTASPASQPPPPETPPTATRFTAEPSPSATRPRPSRRR